MDVWQPNTINRGTRLYVSCIYNMNRFHEADFREEGLNVDANAEQNPLA